MQIVFMPGDGIGPEITTATVKVLEHASARFGFGLHFEEHTIGQSSLARRGTTFPPEVLEACRAADGILLGPVSHADYPSSCPNRISRLPCAR